MTQKSVKEYDVIRAFATVLVVAGHSAYTTMSTFRGGIFVEVSEFSRVHTILLLLVRLIYSFHMPLFFSLSGALYQLGKTEGKWEAFSDLVKIKFKRLILPLFTVSIFYLIPIKWYSGYFSALNNPVKDAFWGQLILFDNSHLWYLASLFWIFIFAWIIDKKVKFAWQKVFLCILAWFAGLWLNENFLGIKEAFSNLIWFFYGVFYEKKRTIFYQFFKRRLYNYILFLTTVFIYFLYLCVFRKNELVYSIVGLCGISISYFLAFTLAKKSQWNNGIIKKINRFSFSIYLYSDPLNYLILKGINDFKLNNVFSSNILSLFMFFFRVLITMIVAMFLGYLFNKIKQCFIHNKR